MEIKSILNTGVEGFQRATEKANQAATEIASSSVRDASTEAVSNKDLTQSLVDLKVAELDAKANAKVIETASDLIGSIIDIKA